MPVADTQLQNLIKITKVRKGSNKTLVTFQGVACIFSKPAPACGLTDGCVAMLSKSQACELSNFVLILLLRHNGRECSIHSACNCACF